MNNESATLPVLGIDWGTTNRRAYLFGPDGQVIRRHQDEMGILGVQGNFSTSLRDLLHSMEIDRADVIMSGMVGSRNGWKEIPYLQHDHPIPALSDALVEIDSGIPAVRCRIVPGYVFRNSAGLPDVMRGEETQVLGALMLGAEDDGWFVLPGTHSKWTAIADGRIVELMTFMTGEMYALLGRHGTLSALMQEKNDNQEAFRSGLDAAGRGGFTHMAFVCRALVVTGAMPPSHAASFLSGLLIGGELHEAGLRSRASGRDGKGIVHVIASATLAPRYQAALEYMGMSARLWNPDSVYEAALNHLARLPAASITAEDRLPSGHR